MTDNTAIDSTTIDALKEIMGDAFGVVIDTFINDTGKLVESLSELQQQNDIEVFTRNAHSIKSSSANLGAMQLSALAAELEAEGKKGEIKDLTEKISEINNQFTLASKELSSLN